MSPLENTGRGILKGLGVTLRHLGRKWITLQYPEQRLGMSRRLRGSQVIFVREYCIACQACARICPVGCIDMAVSRDENHKLRVDRFVIDFGLCIFCGLCVESCPPADAIYMGTGYENTTYRCDTVNENREGLTASDRRCRQFILSGDELAPSASRVRSGYDRPQTEANLPEQELLIDKKTYIEDARARWPGK